MSLMLPTTLRVPTAAGPGAGTLSAAPSRMKLVTSQGRTSRQAKQTVERTSPNSLNWHKSVVQDVKPSLDELQKELKRGLVLVGPGTRGFAPTKSKTKTGHDKRRMNLTEFEIHSKQSAINQVQRQLGDRLRERRSLAETYQVERTELSKRQDKDLVRNSRRHIRNHARLDSDLERVRSQYDQERKDLKAIIEMQQEKLRKYTNEVALLHSYKYKGNEELKKMVIDWKEKRERRAQELVDARQAHQDAWKREKALLEQETKLKLNDLVEGAQSNLIVALKERITEMHNKNHHLKAEVEIHQTAVNMLKKQVEDLQAQKRMAEAERDKEAAQRTVFVSAKFRPCDPESEDGVLRE